jgi:hypothetical protein
VDNIKMDLKEIGCEDLAQIVSNGLLCSHVETSGSVSKLDGPCSKRNVILSAFVIILLYLLSITLLTLTSMT